MKIKTCISFLFIGLLTSALFAEANTANTMTSEEKEVVEYFCTFKDKPSKDNYDKLFKALGNLRSHNKEVKNIYDYIEAVEKKKSVQTTFVSFKFDKGFTNRWEDNRIRIYVMDGKSPEKILDVDDIKTHEGNIVENGGKYYWSTGSSTWSQELKKDYIIVYFENVIAWGFNKRSKHFDISKYEIFAKSCDSGEYIMTLEDSGQKASITLKFSDLPKIRNK